jgi:hypothetical protein
MSRESMVQVLGVVVAAATVLVTVLAVAHLFLKRYLYVFPFKIPRLSARFG